jgi:hypothetical protein
MGFFLVGAVGVQGARGQTESFPFASFPTFETQAPKHIVDLAVELELPEKVETLRLSRTRSDRQWSLTWRVAGLYGNPATESELLDYAKFVIAEAHAQKLAEQASAVRIQRELYEVAPESWNAPPLSKTLLGRISQRDFAD